MPVTIAVNRIIIWYGIRYVYGDVVMLPFKLAVELQAQKIAVLIRDLRFIYESSFPYHVKTARPACFFTPRKGPSRTSATRSGRP
jgi:hypothetical protein